MELIVMINAVTYGRAGIIGNPTDGYGGTLIACSIKNKAEVTIEECNELILENQFDRKILRWQNDLDNQGDYFDVVRSVLRYLKLYDLKAKISVKSNIPLQAGLSGSTAVLSSVLSAVLAFMGKKFNKYELAEINRVIELNYLKCHCGYQDAYMTTFGGLTYLDFRGKEYYKELQKEHYAVVENLSQYVEELPFVIAHTGIKHHSGNFHKPLRERWLEGDKSVVNGYNEIAGIAREGKKALIKGDWEQLAYLMNKNHEIQDSLADSGEQNTYMIKVARENGALAAKLAGAGGGGTIIALTLSPLNTIKALREAGVNEFVELEPGAKGVYVEYSSNINNQFENVKNF
jgi:galactokinase/mevalonate kinase-like predicted kinase